MCLKIIKNKARNEAYKSPCNSKHAAIIVKKNNIIASGFNNPRTSFLGTINNCQHAEMSAITRLNNDFLIKISNIKKKKRFINKCKIYIVRVSRKHNNLTFSAPCKHCYEKLIDFGFNKIYFTDYDGTFVKIDRNFKTNHLSYSQIYFDKYYRC